MNLQKSFGNEKETNMKKISESILLGARLICAVGAMVLASLQVFGVWDKANYVAIPLLAATLVIQSIHERKDHKGVAIFSIIAAVFILVCTVCIMTL